MRETRILMGMPVTVDVGTAANGAMKIADTFAWFDAVDRRFSTYTPTSEVSRINAGKIMRAEYSRDMLEVLALADRTRRESAGYFNITRPDCTLDPSGIVKGWAIRNAARRLELAGAENFFVDAGGDVQVHGVNEEGGSWSIGIRNPFNPKGIVKVIYPHGGGVATSGSYVRGSHIYDPHAPDRDLGEIVSLTVVGPDILEADRFATAAFAMGRDGILFIEERAGLEGYMIDCNGTATMTTGLARYLTP